MIHIFRQMVGLALRAGRLPLILLILSFCFPLPAQNVIRASALPTTNSLQPSNTITATIFPYPHVNSTSGAGGTYQIAISNLASSLIKNQTWVQEGGNLYAAKIATAAYGLISVGPGTHTNGVTNLFFNGSWEFHGSVIDRMGQNTNGFGIFDDRYSGAVTNYIFGQVHLKFCPGTNANWDGACSWIGDTNAFAAIVVTNANTLVQWTASTRLGLYGLAPYPACIYVKNCQTNSVFRGFDEIYNLNPANTFVATNCPAFPNTPFDIDTGCQGFYWELGSCSFKCGRMHDMSVYALQAYGVTNTDVADLYVEADFLDGKCYAVGRSSRWKIWFLNVGEWRNISGNATAVQFYSAGSHYLRAQKISSKFGEVIRLENPTTGGDTNLVVWVNIDKVSGSNGWVRNTHGELRGRIGHLEENGPNSSFVPGIFTTNVSALTDLSGENMYANGGSVTHGGGRTMLRNFSIYSTNRDPVLVTGSGLRLSGVSIITGLNATNCIRSPNAQTVNSYGAVARSNLHANVTIATGTTNFTIAPSVD